MKLKLSQRLRWVVFALSVLAFLAIISNDGMTVARWILVALIVCQAAVLAIDMTRIVRHGDSPEDLDRPGGPYDRLHGRTAKKPVSR